MPLFFKRYHFSILGHEYISAAVCLFCPNRAIFTASVSVTGYVTYYVLQTRVIKRNQNFPLSLENVFGGTSHYLHNNGIIVGAYRKPHLSNHHFLLDNISS